VRCKQAALLALQCSIGLGGVSAVEFLLAPLQQVRMLGNSLGALAILLLCLPKGEFSKTSTIIFSHIIASAIGILCQLTIAPFWMLGALFCAISITIFILYALDIAHPPAGAVALWAVQERVTSEALPWVLVTPALAACIFIFSNAFAWRLFERVFPRYFFCSHQGVNASGSTNRKSAKGNSSNE